ncbi:MAG TPA: hypothetical protein VGC66_15840 [Pyrinomonadaceae bacterium]|jgi:hypothetical protein
MSTTVKIILAVIVGFALLLFVIIGGAVYWWSQHSQEFLDAGKNAYKDGEEFGKKTDNRGCVAETIARHKVSPGFQTSIADNIFLRACLNKSRPTTGFCDAVPKRTEFIKSGQWQKVQCTQAGLSDSYCPQLFSQVQQFCEEDFKQPQQKE